MKDSFDYFDKHPNAAKKRGASKGKYELKYDLNADRGIHDIYDDADTDPDA